MVFLRLLLVMGLGLGLLEPAHALGVIFFELGEARLVGFFAGAAFGAGGFDSVFGRRRADVSLGFESRWRRGGEVGGFWESKMTYLS